MFLMVSFINIVNGQIDRDSLVRAIKDSISSEGKKSGENQPKKPFIKPRTRPIIYDFKTGTYENELKRVRVHTPVIFVIKNINPFAYNIRIAPKDSIIAASSFDKNTLPWVSKEDVAAAEDDIEQTKTTQEAKPEEHEKITSDEGSKTTVDAVNKAIITMVNNDAVIKKDESLQKQLLEVETQIELELTKQRDSSAETESLSSDAVLLESLDKKRGELIKAIAENNARIETNTKNTDPVMKRFTELHAEYMKAYSRFMIDCQRIFRIVRNTRLLTAMAEDPNLSDSLFQKNYRQTFDKVLLEIRKDRDNHSDFRRTYAELNNLFASLKYDPELQQGLSKSGLEKLYAYPNYIKDRADELHSRIIKLPINTYLTQSEWIATKLDSEDAFIFRSVPLQPINDWFEFKVDISKKHESISKDYYIERSFYYHQPTYGGTRVDFSIGLAASYFWNTEVYDLGYVSSAETPESAETSELRIYEKSGYLSAPSVLGLVTMSVRRTKYAAYGGSAGLGIDVLNGKVQLSNFFIGPTLLLGKFDRIFLSIGASVRNVQQLQSGFEENGTAGGATKISQILEDKYNVGGFVSISYSLTDNAKKMLQSLK